MFLHCFRGRFLRLPWLSMTPWGTEAQGMHVLNRVKPTSCQADKSSMQCVARSSTSIFGSDTDPAVLVPAQVSPFLPYRSKCSCGIQAMNQVRPLQAREEPWHPQRGSRGWTACSPSHSWHRILLPDTQHGGLVVWLSVMPAPVGTKLIASLPESHPGCSLVCSPCWQPDSAETLVTCASSAHAPCGATRFLQSTPI